MLDDVPGRCNRKEHVHHNPNQVRGEERPSERGELAPLPLEIEEHLDREEFEEVNGIGKTANQIENRAGMCVEPFWPGDATSSKQHHVQRSHVVAVDLTEQRQIALVVHQDTGDPEWKGRLGELE